MHEAAFVDSIITIVIGEAKKNDVNQVRKIRVCAGAFSCVVAESLEFYFGFASDGTSCEGAELLLERKPALAYCNDCDKEFEVGTDMLIACPDCCGIKVTLKSGHELYVVDFEGE